MTEIQRSFSAGEVSPTLYGRADVERWNSALKTCSNWIVEPEGGITVRQGFEFKTRIAYTLANTVRLIPFEFGPDDSYVQVLHDDTMNLVDSGSLVTGDPIVSITLNAAANPWTGTLTSGGLHGWTIGAGTTLTFYDGPKKSSALAIVVTSTTAFTIAQAADATVTRAHIVRRTTPAGTQTTSYPAPYALANNQALRFTQSGDTQWFTTEGQQPLQVVRENISGVARNLSLTYAAAPVQPAISTVGAPTIAGTVGTDQLRYRVTYTNRDGIESGILRGSPVTGTVTAATSPWIVTAVAHGLITNDVILIDAAVNDLAGNRVYNKGDLIRVVRTAADTFTVAGGSDGLGGPANFTYRKIAGTALLNQPTTSAAITVSWTAVTGADFYNIYREFGRVYGYIGSTSGLTFVDKGIIPDQKDTPITGKNPFEMSDTSATEYPTAVGLFQQRLMFGGFTTDSERIVGSLVGNYITFDPGAEDASGLDFILAGRTVSGIQHMVEIAGRAVVLANTAEWVLRGSTGGSLTPTSINARADSYYGSSTVSPALIGTSLIYVQRGDKIIRDAQYDFAQESLQSKDLTLWSKHLFVTGIKRLVYQRTDQVLWVLLNDGTLAGLTYIPEQSIWGWHRHDISGRTIHDICVVSEGGVDRLYVAALQAGYIEIGRLPLKFVAETSTEDDHLGFDMGLTYNGLLATNATLTGGTTWYTSNTLTMTASGSTFVVGDVGKDFQLRLGTDVVQVICTAYTSATVISVTPRSVVPVALRGVISTSLYACASTVSGLTHLDGTTVGVIADRGVEADAVVSAGAITLSRAFARVQVGIRVTATAQTMDLEASQKDTNLGDFKHVTRVILRFLNSRGVRVGLTETTLEAMANEYGSVINAAPILQSGAKEIIMQAIHEDSGSIIIRQDSGLPASILNARSVFNWGDVR